MEEEREEGGSEDVRKEGIEKRGNEGGGRERKKWRA